MASFLSICLLLLFAHTTWSQEIQSNNVTLGKSLSPTMNSSWLSPSGLYGFGFYQQGQGYKVGIFLAKIPQKTVVWTLYRDDPPVSGNATLQLTTDGRLVLRSSDGSETSISDPSRPALLASMLDSGNFVLYNLRNNEVWQSFDYPTDTLLPTQRLLAGEELFSSISSTDHSTGIFRIKMQHDGNLVMYPKNTSDTAPYSYFTSWTDGKGDNVSLNFDPDGHIYLLNATGSILRNITTGGYPTENMSYRLTVDPDGLMRLYSYNLKGSNGSWWPEWTSDSDRCAPKGLCGLNGYCELVDQEAQCRCPPGFDFVMQGNRAAGCERNFTLETCKGEGEIERYKMEAIDHMQWEDDPYSVLSLSDKESCSKSCLEDCDCHAALFKEDCRKQRLPLRYGRIYSGESTSALIKVGPSSFTNTNTNSPSFPSPGGKKERINKDILIISVLLIVLGSVMLLVSVMIICRNKTWAYKKCDAKAEVEFGTDITPRLFTYVELELCTEDFKEEIGRGAFGTVYKGMIQDSKIPIAVKRLDKWQPEGEKEFRTEVEVIGRTHHRNLVRLLGYCLEGPNRLLVYEYMSNGSLADMLFTPERQLPCWKERMEIARDIARGILYLHEECETQIIHCDIKPQNILMGKCAKISDFGLAKLLAPDQTKTFTGIRGTRGYVAPEWHRRLPVTAKADVYSFGVVLLEIICCRRNIDWCLSESEAVLEDAVRYCFLASECRKLVGDEEVDMRELEEGVMVGLWCIFEDPAFRPTMKKVLHMLEGTAHIPIPAVTSFSSQWCSFSTIA